MNAADSSGNCAHGCTQGNARRRAQAERGYDAPGDRPTAATAQDSCQFGAPPILPKNWWSAELAGILGGCCGGAIAGCVIAAFGLRTAAGVALGAAVGAIAGGISSVHRDVERQLI